MLFLYRPRQTWMPFERPMTRTDQAAYNQQLQRQFQSTRRVQPAVPAATADLASALTEIDRLHRSGALTDAEFESAKAKVLAR